MTKQLYVIQSEAGPVKVGVSAKPRDRLARLMLSQPFSAAIVHVADAPNGLAHAVEAAAHALLSAKRRRGEWFDVTADEAISAIQTAMKAVERGDSLKVAPLMEGRQIRAARAMLGLSQGDLCEAAGISRATLIDLEKETGDPRRSSLEAVEEAFRKKGITFTDDGKSIGVIAPKKR